MRMIPYRKRIKSAKVNLETVLNLSDQIQKYLAKTPDVNTAVNDFAMGIYAGFTNFYRNDNDDDTKGNEILDKVIRKLRALLKEYPDIEVPMNDMDFAEDSSEEEEMPDEEAGDSSSEDEGDAAEKQEEKLKWSDPTRSLGLKWNRESVARRYCRARQKTRPVAFSSEIETALWLKNKAGAALLKQSRVRIEAGGIGVVGVRSATGAKLAFYRKK